MSSSNTGNLLGGAAGARDRRLNRELEAKRVGLVERQLEQQQQQDLLQRTRDQINALTEEAKNIVGNISVGRDDERFAAALAPLREAAATLAARGQESFPGSLDAQNQMALFDAAMAGTPTIQETAVAEAEATVAGAVAQNSAIANLAPEQQEQVRGMLGLQPEFTQEFFGLVQLLEDPNTTPLAREKAAERLNFISSRSEPAQFAFNVDPDGNVTFAQGQGLPSRQTMNAKQMDELRAATDIVVRGRELSGALLENTQTALGALGSLRSGAQTFTGVVSDLLGIPAQEIMTEFEGMLAQLPPEEREAFTVGEVDAAEGILTFAVARAIQGDSNRLLTGSISQAKSMVKLTGLISDEQVRDRLSFINQFLTSQETNFQRRFEQGTTGTTTTERQPVAPSREPIEGNQDLIDEIDALLGDSGG